MTTSASVRNLDVRGYQGSSTTRVKAILYPNANEFAFDIKSRDPRRINIQGALELNGVNEKSSEPGIIAASVQNSLDGAGGSWQLVIKAGDAFNRQAIRSVEANDWVDIAFLRQDQEWHVMRGIVDSNTEHTRVSRGATAREFVLSGGSFLKPIITAPVWFDMFSGDTTEMAALRALMEAPDEDIRAPDKFVKYFLFSYYEELVKSGRAKWKLPPGMPGEVDTDDWLTADAMYDSSGFTNFPPRISAILPNLLRLENLSLWNLAREWSDPPLCELYADLAPVDNVGGRQPLVDAGVASDTDTDVGATSSTPASQTRARNYFQDLQPVPIGSAQSRIIFRDCPFPSPTRDLEPERSPWFTTIPLFETSREGVTEMHLSKDDSERANAFYCAIRSIQSLAGLSASLMGALWDEDDVSTAGLRRMDVTSSYVGDVFKEDKEKSLLMPGDYRRVVRDFFCMNHLLLSGEIQLAPGRPDVRVGSRFRVRGPVPEDDVTGYVQGIRHEWSMPAGLRTTLNVTRGWVGTDDDLWTTLLNYVNSYSEIGPTAGAEGESAVTAYRMRAADRVTYAPTAKGGPPPELHYPPGSQKMIELFLEAAAVVGVPEDWVYSPDLKSLLEQESGGWVGRPTGRLCKKRGIDTFDYVGWVAIHDEFKALPLNRSVPSDWVLKTHTPDKSLWDSTATGLGQLLLQEVDTKYPGATKAERRAGIGVPLAEAVGMLAYIKERYPSGPTQAWAFWQAHHWY